MKLAYYFTTTNVLAALLACLCDAFTTTSSPRSSNSELLPPLLETAMAQGLLVRPRPNIFVLGTVHIGSTSADEATLLIETIQPSVVILEVAPSRIDTMRRRNQQAQKQDKPPLSTTFNPSPSSSSLSSSNPFALLQALPALAEKGWTQGGLGGLVFATTMVWGSLVKRSLTTREEVDTLPRVDEFAAALAATDQVGATVVACDVEMDQLLRQVSHAMSPPEWLSLAARVVSETLGWQAGDPIRRQPHESVVAWAQRRRQLATARASRKHGQVMSASLDRVLVEDRDARFAQACQEAIALQQQYCADNGEKKKNDATATVVCIVGLVHLDGVVQRLATTNETTGTFELAASE